MRTIMIILTKMSRLIDLWDNMRNASPQTTVKQLYVQGAALQVYAIYNPVSNCYGIAFSFNNTISANIKPFENLSEMKVSIRPDLSFTCNKLLMVELYNQDNLNVFSALCENLIRSIMNIQNDSSAVHEILNQIVRWKLLLSKSREEGLTPQQQLGLYGELFFLAKFLNNCKCASLYDVVDKWVGIEAAVRDFRGANWAVEVKTTKANNQDIVKINGARQLDDNLVNNLFLYHLSVDASGSNGINLNQMVGNVRHILRQDLAALHLFEDKLLTLGYFAQHANRYEDKHYVTRTENVYKVELNFPRIREAELRSGVEDVEYTISLSMCQNYLVTESSLFNIIA